MRSLGRCAFAVATLLFAAGCGSSSSLTTQPSDQPAFGQGAVKLSVELQGHTASHPDWAHDLTLRAGQPITLRLLIRNNGANQSGDVRAALRLPHSLVVDPASVTERSVPEVEALGDAVTDPEQLTGRGLVLGPFPPRTFTTIQLTAKTRGGGAGGTLTPTARVTTQGTDATTQISVRLSG